MKRNLSMLAALPLSLLITASQAFAYCPSGKGPVHDDQVAQFLTEAKLLSDAGDRNKSIEKCFKRNSSVLTYEQFSEMYDSVGDTYPAGHHDADHTHNRMIDRYFDQRVSFLTQAQVAEMARSVPSPAEGNDLIEKYISVHQEKLTIAEAETLAGGLRDEGYTSSNRSRRDKISDKIFKRTFKAKEADMSVAQAGELADRETDGGKANDLVEEYVSSHMDKLSIADVETLVGNLKDDGYTSSNRSRMQKKADRILKSTFEAKQGTMTAASAAELASRQNRDGETNELLQAFEKQNLSRLGWEEIRTLVAAVKQDGETASNRSRGEIVQTRMIERFFDARVQVMPVDLAIAAATSVARGEDCNELLEKYFDANIGNLTWPQEQQIIASLRDSYNGEGHHSRQKTQDRILKALQK